MVGREKARSYMFNFKNAKMLLSGAAVAICIACGCGPKSHSAEGLGQNPSDICHEPTVGIEVGPGEGPEDYLYLDDLQRAALVRLKSDFGFSYSNTWKLGVVINSISLTNAVVCSIQYHYQKGRPEYLIEFDRAGKIVGCQRIVATHGRSLDEVYPDWEARLTGTNNAKAVSDK